MNRERLDCRVCLPPAAFLMLWLVLTCVPETILAQSAGETQEPSFAPDTTIEKSGRDSDRPSAVRLPVSTVPWFLREMRSSVGFSVGIFGYYDPNAIVSSSGQNPEGVKSAWVTPSLFANVRKRRSQVTLNYSFQARAYSGNSQLKSSSHTATLNFTRALSPKLSIGLGDVFTSALGDQRTFLDPTVLGASELNAAQDLDVSSQRVSRNSISATASYQMSRRNTIGVFSSYDYWRYTDVSLGNNAYDILVGVHSGLRINKWLYLDNSYSHYLTSANNPLGSGNSQIHHLQVAGLRLARSKRGWETFLSGGADISTSGGRPLPVPSMQAGVSKTWKSGGFTVTYSRGLWTAVGSGTALQGDTANLAFNQSLRRLSLTVGSTFRLGTASGGSRAEFVSPNAQLSFAAQRHLMLSANYWYVSQQVANISPAVQNASRYRVGVGINCFLPPLFNR
jgi:hypothetical protein